MEFRSLKDIHSYYHNWRKDKTNSNLDLFQAYILSEYQTSIEHFNIKLDYKKPYDLDNIETDDILKI